MTEQQLAHALIQKGLLSPPQVKAAAQQRGPGRSFAHVIVDMNLVSTLDVLETDPHAFDDVPVEEEKSAGAPTVGLGQDAAAKGDDSGVVLSGDFAATDDGTANYVVHFCNELLAFAVELRASDLHLEPREVGLVPRYRVDGELRTFGEPIEREMQLPIISRFKVLSNLDITENRLPQDGRFRAIIGGRVFDFRVSSLPGVHGEKLVMRLLDRSALVTDLTKLGFSSSDRARFEEMLQRSYGMVLVTGPTGSGKTTTLYAALAATRDETKNVITVEDPVEYELSDVTQTNVRSEIGLTFATQLRAILRQDPDVILVGEIRDDETADIAVRAALTGHLLLSTLHTNSAVAAVARLQDMNVPNFLLASSLSGVLAQRLVRLICRSCRQTVDQSTAQYDIDITRLRLPSGSVLYHGAGCDQCNNSGLRGRMALIELLNIDAEFRRAIMSGQDADTLRRLAVKSGMKTLWRDGIDKVLRGLTTADEVARALLGAEDPEADISGAELTTES